MSTGTPQAQAVPHHPHPAEVPELTIYGHSPLLFWWPVWVTGYIMALITGLHGSKPVDIGPSQAMFYPSNALGIIYILVLALVILLTNTRVRGPSSVIAILALALAVMVVTYYDWWNTILEWLGHQSVHMNAGFYVFSSTLLFILWAFTVFVVDRLSYWKIRPGQITHEYVLGAVDQTYDTDAMVLTKDQSDIFRHLILGLGSGDLHMQTQGGTGREATAHNVLWVSRKITAMDRLIATKPDLPQQA